MSEIRIMAYALKLSAMAVCADLFYIIARMASPLETIDDISFILAVPDMLETMLLSAAIIMSFGALGAYVILSGDKDGLN